MPKRPKLGQHFLQDPEVLDRIAGSAVASGDTAVEIGPGRGALTKCLLRLASRVVAVEIDAGLARDLPRACGHSPRLQVVEADALRVNLASLPGDAKPDRSVLAGNLPYYITSPVLRAVFAARGAFRCATFLVQREVAERIVASGGSRAFGYLSCLCQLHSAPRLLFTVPPGAFSPPPAVESAAVRLDLRPQAPPRALLRFLRACLSAPRKTLKNNLRGLYGADLVARDPNAGQRAQQLGLEGLVRMWERIESQEGPRPGRLP